MPVVNQAPVRISPGVEAAPAAETVKSPLRVMGVAVVAPRAVTVARVSTSAVRPLLLLVLVELDEIVIVEPLVVIVLPPLPLMEIAPLAPFTVVEESTAALSMEMTAFWPPATVTPVPPVTE